MYCKTCQTETEVKQTEHLTRCMMCGDSEGLVFEDDYNYQNITSEQIDEMGEYYGEN